jgi:hypothetical protein
VNRQNTMRGKEYVERSIGANIDDNFEQEYNEDVMSKNECGKIGRVPE